MDQTLTSLDKSLSTLIDGATEKGTKLVDFLYEQAPEVTSQLLLWHGIESFIIFIACILLLIVAIYGNIKSVLALKKFLGNGWETDPTFWLPTIIGSGMGQRIVSIVIAGNINLTWLKIYIAPKVYLLEYVANLTK